MNKFIYFDVGGVLIKDFSGNEGWKHLKEAIGISSENESTFDAYWKEITHQVCTSQDVDELIPVLKEKFNITVDNDYSLLKAFVDRFERYEFMQNICDTISLNHDTGLLTNMYPKMLDEIIQQNKLPKCDWKNIIDSSIIGMAKPEKDIFQYAAKECGREPQDILFVDNTNENLVVAESLGWQTFLFDSKHPEESAKRLLEKLNI